MIDQFKFKKWEHLLHFSHIFYLDIVRQFYTNIRQREIPSDIVSRVNGVDFKFDPYIVNQIFNTQIEGNCKSKFAYFLSYEELPSSINHFDPSKLMKYFKTNFTSPNEADWNDFIPIQQILFLMIGNLLIFRSGHRTDANKMELYLFYYFIERIRVDLVLFYVIL